MSDRGRSPTPSLADPPTSPFQPSRVTSPSTLSPFQVVLPSASSRRPIVRRAPAGPAPRPFGEIGKENDDNDWDIASVLSASSIAGPGDNEEDAPFVPRWRNLDMRRPVVRKPTMTTEPQRREGLVDVKKTEGAGPKLVTDGGPGETPSQAAPEADGNPQAEKPRSPSQKPAEPPVPAPDAPTEQSTPSTKASPSPTAST
ncbi:hypothetical protein JCM11641_007241 [Rhodosporidiobolus odoratus]